MAVFLSTCFIGLVYAAVAVVAQTSGTFNVLSMNVAGLPAILNGNGESGDKTTNTMIIGQDFNKYKYDLIHVQEDFNYHATLYQYDTHPQRTATSGGVPFGSGLNSLSNYGWSDFVRTKWATCSDASENDCLTPKGFTFMRWNPAPGVEIDVINLHADAGTEAGDETARTANMQQVVDYIGSNSAGNPVIVFGDTNSRWTRSLDNIPSVVKQAGLTDAWVQLARKGVAPTPGAPDIVCSGPVPADTSCEVVDKVLYRSSKAISLTATAFAYDTSRFLSSNGTTLTDHNPVRVEFSWSFASNFQTSDLYGGPHGDWYSDLDSLPTNPTVSSVTVAGADRLDSVSFKLSSGLTLTHGGTGGTASTLTLASGEYINSAKLCWAQYDSHTRNFYIQLGTSAGRSVSSGTTTSDCATATAPSGFAIVGMRGRDGDEMDLLGWIYAKRA